jgi:hypothetical protein
MPDGERPPFDQLIAKLDPDLIAAARRLRELVFEVDPHTVEIIRLRSRTATYGVGAHETSEGYVYIRPFVRWVSLGFYQGTHLDDPEGLLEGTDPVLRHLKVATFNSAEETTTRALIESAVAEQRRSLGI